MYTENDHLILELFSALVSFSSVHIFGVPVLSTLHVLLISIEY